ncbi:MAG: recombination protein NinB [Allorhizobium sp.]
MSRALIVIRSQADRDQAARWAHGVPVGTRIEFKETKRSVPQNDRFYAMLTDIAAEMKKRGRDHDVSQWKTIFLAAFGHEVKFLPSLDQKTFIPLGHSSSDLSVKEMSDLMEFMTAWAAENNVPLRDSNDAAAASAASTEEAEESPASTPAPASSVLQHHLMDFARKGFKTLSDDIDDDAKTTALDMMVGGYQALIDTGDITAEDWPKFESIVKVFRAVFTGKKTIEEGRQVVAADFIGCKINQIGG